MNEKTVLYTAELCSDCQHLKRFMDDNRIPYELRDIRQNAAYADELKSHTGKQGVPYLQIDGKWVRGYDPGKPFTDEFARSLFGL